MIRGAAFSLAQRFSLLAQCRGADLLAAADRAIEADQAARRLLCDRDARVRVDVQTRFGDRGVRVKSVLWSVQVPDHACPGLAARTLHLTPQAALWFDRAKDPGLPLSDLPKGASLLRYIPARRATLRIGYGPDGTILKLKKPDRRDDAVLRHRAVLAAARGSGLRMPDLIGTCGTHGLRQTLCPGTALDASPCRIEQLRAVGRLVAQLHALDAQALPEAPASSAAEAWLEAILPGLPPPTDLRQPKTGRSCAMATSPWGSFWMGRRACFWSIWIAVIGAVRPRIWPGCWCPCRMSRGWPTAMPQRRRSAKGISTRPRCLPDLAQRWPLRSWIGCGFC